MPRYTEEQRSKFVEEVNELIAEGASTQEATKAVGVALESYKAWSKKKPTKGPKKPKRDEMAVGVTTHFEPILGELDLVSFYLAGKKGLSLAQAFDTLSSKA